ncbi:MAG: CbtB-domain containing protein [Deltaproteobacteria bacterium]|nr:CbtB-domain containing protein [Deltaproteobacteria bacterium]
MERILESAGMKKAVVTALVLVGVAFTFAVIAYGMDSVAPGVHDAFHDFRHAIGMGCH